jgi:VWFA-related protein
VNVLATVRDKQGKIVNNLSKDDFILDEDGRPQTIKYFTRETDLPLTLGLLVDTSLSQRRVLDKERSASGTFVDQVLREDKDKAFLIHFDREVELLQDLTSSRQKLEEGLRLLQMPEPEHDRGSGGGGYPRGGGYPGGGYPGGGGSGGSNPHRRAAGTLLYDAVFLASDEMLLKQQGRKAIVILTDGVDQGSKLSLDRAIEAAQRADTVVYSILFADPDAYQHGFGGGGMNGPWGGRRGGGYPRSPQPQQEHPDGKKVLQRISQETGGRMFEVSKKLTVDQIYQQIQDELRNQYNLGYTPDHAVNGSDYHKIHLLTKEKDLVVQARDGYYSARPLAPSDDRAQK